jgi:hypothetical protein
MAVEKAIPIYKKELRVFNLYYLQVPLFCIPHTPTHIHSQKNQKKYFARRWYQDASWYSAGRVGEIAKMTADHLTFDSEFRNLRADWTQLKTGKMKVIFWNNHATDYVACPLNALYAHLVTSRTDQPRDNFLFVELCDLQKPSNKIGESYRDFYADEENPFLNDVPAGITGSVFLIAAPS